MKVWAETISFKYLKTVLEGVCPQTDGVAEEDNHQLHLSVAWELQEGFRKKKKEKRGSHYKWVIKQPKVCAGLGTPGSSL